MLKGSFPANHYEVAEVWRSGKGLFRLQSCFETLAAKRRNMPQCFCHFNNGSPATSDPDLHCDANSDKTFLAVYG